MPPKWKKTSKAASKHSFFDQAASLQSSSSSTPLPEPEVREDILVCSLQEASNKYPSLVGISAFTGQVTDVVVESKGCKIWLSESSMVASSLAPGYTVSVSLASLRKKSNSFPLCSLADECAKHFGICCIDKMVTEVGNYFALATVFPSSKVLDNGVRLSSNLSCTLGCPASGRIIFVYSVQGQSPMGVNGNVEFNGPSKKCLSLSNCTELYLELVSSKKGFTKNSNVLAGRDSPQQRTGGLSENGNNGSPMTPACSQSKLSSLVISQSSFPRSEESISCSPDLYETSFDTFEIPEVLADESVKKLLQSCAASWLSSRILLYGNFVTIPILSKICIFQVMCAPGISGNGININQDESGWGLCHGSPDIMHHVDDAFVVNHKTKVHLTSPLDSSVETPQRRGLPCLELESEDTKADVVDDSLKLGGLAKEYAILKDIIASSVKDTLLRLGLRPTKGVLLHGPPGTGKTSLAKKCANDTGVNLFTVNGPELVSQYYGESEKALHEVFDSASQAKPAVVRFLTAPSHENKKNVKSTK